MKKLLSTFILMLATLLAYSTPVYAKGIPLFFGEQEEIHKIADVNLKGGEGEDLFIGYRTRELYLLAGVYVTDEGYILGVTSDESKYYPFPSGDELKAFQESGMLPEKLPEYSLSTLDYIFGYSLWLIALLGLLYYFMKKALVKRDH
ncbi:MAG: hypothetical protein KJ675_07200 [Gammaproteobacteria bacterium]|nr:hypothetical protein [Gammaproteobacteria bacterium]MBU1960994.1 hypothetical protein [Gammaproteobacteria bacterium]